jgi:hypothetical protein
VINQPPVQYRGEDLEAERGPGLGCFRFQVAVLIFFIILTPLTVAWSWPTWISAALLFATIALLLVAGQTIIFLLRLVAADRRSRRRPLGSATKTVGELEDEGTMADGNAAMDATAAADGIAAVAESAGAAEPAGDPADAEGPVRQ